MYRDVEKGELFEFLAFERRVHSFPCVYTVMLKGDFKGT